MRPVLSFMYSVTRRDAFAAGTKKYVSLMPSGPVMRVRMKSSSESPDARSTTQPRMSVLYP